MTTEVLVEMKEDDKLAEFQEAIDSDCALVIRYTVLADYYILKVVV